MAPLGNDPIMSVRLIRSFRHLECQNLSFISDSIDQARWCNNSGGTEQNGTEERRNETERRTVGLEDVIYKTRPDMIVFMT